MSAAKTDETGGLIYSRMAAVLSQLPAIGKNQRNTQQDFRFRGIDDVLNALHSCLSANAVFYLPTVLERIPEIRQTRGGGTLWAVHLHVQYCFYTVDGSFVVADAWGEGTDMADKATSKAMTMAQKSTLVQAFSIATEDMDDADRGGEESSPVVPDPDGWFRDAGWADKASHDAWRAARVDDIKGKTAEEKKDFKTHCTDHKIPAFSAGAHTRAQADQIDLYLGTHEHEYDEVDGKAFCVVCGEKAPA